MTDSERRQKLADSRNRKPVHFAPAATVARTFSGGPKLPGDSPKVDGSFGIR
jgi:hypothetical protein